MNIINRVSKYDRAARMKVRAGIMLRPESLDVFIKYSKSHPIPKADVFREKLLESLNHKPRPAADEAKIEKILASLPCLKNDRELGFAAVAKVAETLGLASVPGLNTEISLLCETYYKARVLQCLMLKALMTVMPRKKALEYFEGFLEQRYKLIKFPKLKNVREKLDLHKQVKSGPLKDGAVFLQGVTDDERAVMKITRCRPAQVLLGLVKDPQIVHAVICRPDFMWAQKSNPAFVLTREKSLVLGMPYCGHVWHDRRVHSVIKHPSRKFWRELSAV